MTASIAKEVVRIWSSFDRLEAHVSECVYRPVTRPNDKCDAIVNRADLDEHTSEVCEYREVYCDECGDKMSVKKFGKHGCIISKDVNEIKVALFQVQNQVKEMFDMQKEIFEAFKYLATPEADGKTSIAKPKDGSSLKHEQNPEGNIVVVGGRNGLLSFLNSVEIFSLTKRTWTKLAPMQIKRVSPTAHLYQGKVMVTGGFCGFGKVAASIEYLRIHEDTNLANNAGTAEVSQLVRELPFECYNHRTKIINDNLWIVGGYDSNQKKCSNAIYMLPVSSNGTTHLKHRMSKPLVGHGLEIVNDNQLLILGGSKTGSLYGAVSFVVQYNV